MTTHRTARFWSLRLWETVLFVMFGVGGVFFVVYGIATNDRVTVTFALACFAMSKAANAMLRTFDREERDRG